MAVILNLDSFLAGLEDEISEAKQAILIETKQAASAVLGEAVATTPEVTGLHKGSWVVGLGSDPGPSGNHPDPGGSTVLAQGLSEIGAAQLGQDIIIANDGPAIEELDMGRSDQAPAGISDAAIAAGTRG